MSEKRILDETTASVAASDDYLYIDGQTNGSRKITPENIVLNSTTAQLLAQHIEDAADDLESVQGDISDLQGNVADVKSDLGDLSELDTTDKSSIVNAINEARGSGGSGLTADIKTALLQIAQKVAYIDEHGQDYYDDLYDALYAITAITLSTNSISLQSIGATSQLTATTTPAGGNVTWSSSNTSVATVSSTGLVTSVAYGSATITATAGSVSATCSVVVAQATCTGITATYTQSGTVYDSDTLDSLKTDLVVTASWSNGTTSTLADTDYTLSGTLAEGTSTVTVAYGGQTDTFDVTVSHADSIAFMSGTILSTGEETESTTRVKSGYIPMSDGYNGKIPVSLINGNTSEESTSIDVVKARIGGIDQSTGAETENSARMATQWIKLRVPQNDGQITVTCLTGYFIKIFEYDENKALISTVIGTLTTTTITGTMNSSARFVKILFKKSDNSDFTLEELSAVHLEINGIKMRFSLQDGNEPLNYALRMYDSGKAFLHATLIPTQILETNAHYYTGNGWLWSDIDYICTVVPTGTEYIRFIGKRNDEADISDVAGSLNIDDNLYSVVYEENT